MHETDRREFIKKLAAGALSAPLAARQLLQSAPSPAAPSRIKKGDMYFRKLGRTELLVSEISLGGSPIPERPVLFQSIERGINYIDTSHTYMNGNSERGIGEALKEFGRDKIHVATKFHLRRSWSRETIVDTVESSLKRLQTDYIDVLCIHGASDPELLTDERVLEAFERLRKEGKYRFRGLSCHSNHENIVEKAVSCGVYDMILLGYNVFDIKESDEEIEVYDDYLQACGLSRMISSAKEKNVGIIAMKTLKVGGRRQKLEKYEDGTASSYQAMLKWALSNPDISSVATEMMNFRELEEDLAVVGML